MKIVADTNTFLAVALNEPEKSRIIFLTIGHELIAPDVLPFEIGNALSAMVRRGKLRTDEAILAWKAIQAIPINLKKIEFEKALAIAFQYMIYAYDAYFIECAVKLRSPLLSLDGQLKSVAQNHGVKILE